MEATMASDASIRAIVYGRQSVGSERSIQEQLDIGGDRARAEGWQLAGPPLTDKVSASRYGHHARDGWSEALGMLPTISAIWMWESSRGDRTLSSWALFLEQCREHGVRIYVETAERYYDMRKASDWQALANDGINNAMESEKRSQQVGRAMNANARDGKPHGHTPFGYRRTYDPATGDLIGQDIEPAEAATVREVYARLRKGESLRSVARDLNARGMLTRSGSGWTPSNLREMVLRPAYAGMRVHHGQETPASWPEIVDYETFGSVRERLTDPARVTTRPGKAKHLLSLIVKCGKCGGPLTATNRYKTTHGKTTDVRAWSLFCRDRGCARIAEDDIDRYVTDVTVKWLADSSRYVTGKTDTGEIAKLKSEIAELTHRRENLTLALAAGMDPVQVAKSDAMVAGQIAELAARVREMAVPAALRDMLSDGDRQDDIRARWDAAPVSARRDVLRLIIDVTGKAPYLVKREAGRTDASTRVEWRKA